QTLDGIDISLTLPIDKATELITSKHEVMNNLLWPELGTVRAVNMYDSNEKKNFWYEYFTRKLEEQKSTLKTITEVSECLAGENCLLEDTQSISVDKGTVCRGNVLVKSDENISLTPNITSGSATSGCIFLAKGNIYIKGGDYLSGGSSEVKYDRIDGFLIAEDTIEVEYVDQSRIVRDGLEIHGSVIALGRNQENTVALNVRRDLRLYNYTYPTLVVSTDAKYMKIADRFFGTESPIYKKEVGFKGL
ncbi:hypothetical protein GYA44_01885, partial [Candidatus Microgenomates bacterium]|nr:hypothetical protein [Candidatus Microgenomates bacterium]